MALVPIHQPAEGYLQTNGVQTNFLAKDMMSWSIGISSGVCTIMKVAQSRTHMESIGFAMYCTPIG